MAARLHTLSLLIEQLLFDADLLLTVIFLI